MGNCQAIDNATLVIQHPSGRVDMLYWPVTASEIMKMNPGHYVALLLTTTLYPTTTTTTTTNNNSNNRHHHTTTNNNNSVRITRIKLLRPTDTLVLGHAYRLIPAEEVMKGLWAKKYGKMKKQSGSVEEKQERMKEKPGLDYDQTSARRSEMERTNQVTKHEKHRPRTTSSSSANSAAAKSRVWQPSLKSISEAAS